MPKKKTQKLYAYVDESGQDTKGRFFVVGVVVLKKERDKLLHLLEEIEKESGKKNSKWRKTRPQHRKKYFELIAKSPLFVHKLFFEVFSDSKKYFEMTSFATAKAILENVSYRNYLATIYVDGFTKREIEKFTLGLKTLHIRKKVKNIRKEETDPLIRLADALCGLVRDAQEGHSWSKLILRKLKKKGAVIAL